MSGRNFLEAMAIRYAIGSMKNWSARFGNRLEPMQV
jgi:hypothetical protein